MKGFATKTGHLLAFIGSALLAARSQSAAAGMVTRSLGAETQI